MASLYFKKLDDLQNQIYDNIGLYATLNESDYEIVELERNKILAKVKTLFLAFNNFIYALQKKVASDEDKLRLELYQSKLVHLKAQYRELLVLSNDLDSKRAHDERLKRFKVKDSPIQGTKEDLFAGRSKEQNEKINIEKMESQIFSKNKQITSTLQATKQLLTSSIIQTELNIETVEQQTKDLGDLNEQLFKLSDVLKKSSQIVKFIENQDKGDKRRIFLSIYFFTACCSWVIWKRILKTPVKILLWSFFKIFRIFNWLFLSNTKDLVLESSDDIVLSATLTTVIMGLAASSVLTSQASTETIDMTKEFVIDVSQEREGDWDLDSSTTSARLIDEL